MSAASKASSLDIGEPEACPSQLRAENTVLLLEVLDHLLLVAIHPAGEGQDQELQREAIHGSRLPDRGAEIGRSAKVELGDNLPIS